MRCFYLFVLLHLCLQIYFVLVDLVDEFDPGVGLFIKNGKCINMRFDCNWVPKVQLNIKYADVMQSLKCIFLLSVNKNACLFEKNALYLQS